MTSLRSHKHASKARWIVLVNVVLFGLIGFGFVEEYLRNQDIEAEIARMQQENTQLEAERLSSLALIDTLSSAYFVEGEARQSGMGKAGEELIIVQDLSGTPEASPRVLYSDIPNPLRWFYYFFDREQFETLQDV